MTNDRVGILLAGGTGSRLSPLTKVVSKQLLPVYNKPMIFYSLGVLFLSGVRDVSIVTNTEYLETYEKLLGDGSKFGAKLRYVGQIKPEGIPQAITLCHEHVCDKPIALMLGDNIFLGPQLTPKLKKANNSMTGARVFGYEVNDPSMFGVPILDGAGKVVKIVEKPVDPPSRYAITGLYFYDSKVHSMVPRLKKSARGEYEISELNSEYARLGELEIDLLGRGYNWFDTGSFQGLSDASNLIRLFEENQKYQIGNLYEIAIRNGWLSKSDVILSQEVEESDRGYIMALNDLKD